MEHLPEHNEDVPWGHVVLRMLLASVPWAGGALDIAYTTWMNQRHDRLGDVAQGLHSGAHEADLLRAVEDNPDVLDLWLRAAEAGQRARIRRARVALGRAVAKAATDPAQWDEAELLVDALSELREPHATLLARLAALEDEARTIVGEDASTSQLRRETSDRAKEVADEYPMAIHQTLLRHGLVVSHGMSFRGVSSAHETTELGRRLLSELEAAADVDPDIQQD